MLGNGIVGILSKRRVPLTLSHCAWLLHGGSGKTGVSRIVLQPSTKRIHHDALYEDVGCEVSEDLSECGPILGIKQPRLEMILPDRACAFFFHAHKAQRENMPLLDKVLAGRASLFDFELIVGFQGKRLLAFGRFAGRAGMIDFLSGLGQRFLSLGYSTPFLSLGASYMYSSLAMSKAAVISVGEEIATMGLPSGISPLVFVFTGAGNEAEIILKYNELQSEPFNCVVTNTSSRGQAKDIKEAGQASKKVCQVYGCVATCQDMVEPKDSSKLFDKVDYYCRIERLPLYQKL